ncbi:hypothetical protein PR048_022503 [Dryococelus australis]|uniref:Uncharacterized protein n=1 Tax=Dryococelus australis TaxID=614101 RepID=A0ABQ9H155_9NEOP|nr:hypothetical protein PR048_022503 [Dryococelus australis]
MRQKHCSLVQSRVVSGDGVLDGRALSPESLTRFSTSNEGCGGGEERLVGESLKYAKRLESMTSATRATEACSKRRTQPGASRLPAELRAKLCRPDKEIWLDAVEEELKALKENHTWEVARKQNKEPLIDSKWENQVSITGGFGPGFDHVGIVTDDASGQRVFSGISRLPSLLHSSADPYSPRFTLIGSQDLDVKSSLDLFSCSSHLL